MSYCVNCGVELDSSLHSCPLCHTPVINPAELTRLRAASPYATEKGEVAEVKRKDMAILIILVLSSTSLSCLVLNLFVFSSSLWSLFVIGACLVLFVMCIPLVIYPKLPVYIALLLVGIAVGLYLYMITFNTQHSDWFWKLALPITALATILVEIFALLQEQMPSRPLVLILYCFAGIAFFSVALELLIDSYLGNPLRLVWSAIVLTVCSVIIVVLITVMSRRRLHNEVRKRLHF